MDDYEEKDSGELIMRSDLQFSVRAVDACGFTRFPL